MSFSDALPKSSVEDKKNYEAKIWSLKRSGNYGSKHVNERKLEVTRASLSADGKTLRLEIANFQPTWCMEIKCSFESSTGERIERVIHNTVHTIPARN